MITMVNNMHLGFYSPGTSYNPTTGQHYVTDPNALNKVIGTGGTTAIEEPAYMQPYQQYISDPTSEYINQLKEAQRRSRIAALDKTKDAALGEP